MAGEPDKPFSTAGMAGGADNNRRLLWHTAAGRAAARCCRRRRCLQAFLVGLAASSFEPQLADQSCGPVLRAAVGRASSRACACSSWQQRRQMEVIVEFRAGLMALQEGRLVADPRKGALRVCQVRCGVPTCWARSPPATSASHRAAVLAAGRNRRRRSSATTCRTRRAWRTCAGTSAARRGSWRGSRRRTL